MTVQNIRQKHIQEEQYSFPYHYIPTWDGEHYSFARTMNWGHIYLSYLYFVVNTVCEQHFDSLLDVGCGDGRFLHELNQKKPGKRLCGIDYFQPAIEFARIVNPNLQWTCGRLEEKDLFPPFDIITLIDVLEHIRPENLKEFIRGVDQYLLANGTLIITVPSKNTPVQKKHYQHFDADSLQRVLHPYFKVREVFYLNRRPSRFEQKIRRLLANRMYIIMYPKLLGWLYKYYQKHLLIADKDDSWRIAVTCHKQACHAH